MDVDFETGLRAAHRRECGYRAIERAQYSDASSHLLHAAADYDRIGQIDTATTLRSIADVCFDKARKAGQACYFG